MSIMPSREDMQRAYHLLDAEIKGIEAKAAPYRAKYDDLRRQENEFSDLHIKPARAAMELAEAQLFEKKQELGLLSRALGGKVGEPESVA